MKTLGSKLGSCTLCKFKLLNNKYIRNICSINIEGRWICGVCLEMLEPAAKEAAKAYRQEKYTPKKLKVKNTYNVTVDPATGRLKRDSFK